MPGRFPGLTRPSSQAARAITTLKTILIYIYTECTRGCHPRAQIAAPRATPALTVAVARDKSTSTARKSGKRHLSSAGEKCTHPPPHPHCGASRVPSSETALTGPFRQTAGNSSHPGSRTRRPPQRRHAKRAKAPARQPASPPRPRTEERQPAPAGPHPADSPAGGMDSKTPATTPAAPRDRPRLAPNNRPGEKARNPRSEAVHA
jgi:hypothetical protein